jgi:hypothetical protein
MVEPLAKRTLNTYLVHFIRNRKYLNFVTNELESLSQLYGQVSKQELYQDP